MKKNMKRAMLPVTVGTVGSPTLNAGGSNAGTAAPSEELVQALFSAWLATDEGQRVSTFGNVTSAQIFQRWLFKAFRAGVRDTLK